MLHMTPDERETALQKSKMHLKKLFEQEKTQILSEIPQSYSRYFGMVGFAKWDDVYYNNESLPALVMSPYDIPPGDARELWLSRHKIVQAGQGKESSARHYPMPLLIHWLGALKEERYSLVPQSDFVSHTNASPDLWQLHHSAKQKQSNSRSLTAKEQYLLRSMEVLEREMKKEPSLRRGDGSLDFQESYDLLTLEDVSVCSVTTSED